MWKKALIAKPVERTLQRPWRSRKAGEGENREMKD